MQYELTFTGSVGVIIPKKKRTLFLKGKISRFETIKIKQEPPTVWIKNKQQCYICRCIRSLCPNSDLFTDQFYLHTEKCRAKTLGTHTCRHAVILTCVGQITSTMYTHLLPKIQKNKTLLANKAKLFFFYKKFTKRNTSSYQTLTDSCLDYTPPSSLCVSAVWLYVTSTI